MNRQAASGQERRPIQGPHAPDCVAIPEARQGSRRAQLRLPLHPMAANKLAAFAREDAHRGLADRKKPFKPFERRLRTDEHRMKRSDRSRTELVEGRPFAGWVGV